MPFNHSTKRAFTLVEMIVSLAIFSIVAVVALSALVRIISANQKAQSLQNALTNLNYVLESMSRELRVGSKYCQVVNNQCDTDTIVFQSSEIDISSVPPCNLAYSYRFMNDSIEKAQQSKGNNCADTFTLNSYTPVTSPNITITGHQITVSNNTGNQYPLISIQISGSAGNKEKTKTDFSLQTSVSARVP